MRHGEALSPQRDPERGLSENGKAKIKMVAAHLLNKKISFQQVLHSKKKRARETAEIMAQTLSPTVTPVEHSHITPNDDPALIISEINDWDNDTLITSHLPFVPNLITALTGQDAYLSAITFETGTIICLERMGNANWAIQWSTSPSEL